MLAARRLETVENSHEPFDRPIGKSRDTRSDVVGRLAAFATPFWHPKGAALFAEGQSPRGVFILYAGRVKLFTSSADGRARILKFADPGEILGLAAALSGQPYEAWAEAIQPTQTGFVERAYLVQLIRRHGDLAMRVALQLGESYYSAIAGVRAMGRLRSARQKLATFLLNWCENDRPACDETSARLTLTHEEISQVIGTSRETVTRLLSGFKAKGLIQWKGCNLILTDRLALESSAAT